MKFSSSSFRKWSRVIHRDLSFFFSGMVLIYAISGIVMNHRDSINPNFTVKQQEYVLSEPLPAKAQINKKTVLSLLEPLGEAGNYTKHYFPREEVMKVFLKGIVHHCIPVLMFLHPHVRAPFPVRCLSAYQALLLLSFSNLSV